MTRVGERWVTLGYQAHCAATAEDGTTCDEDGTGGGFEVDRLKVQRWAREHKRTVGRHKVYIERHQRRRV